MKNKVPEPARVSASVLEDVAVSCSLSVSACVYIINIGAVPVSDLGGVSICVSASEGAAALVSSSQGAIVPVCGS